MGDHRLYSTVGFRQSHRPRGRVRRRCDAVLPDLDQGMRQSAALTVDRDRVVDGIVHGIGFVVADDEFPVGLERLEHERGQSAVAPVGDGDCPRGDAGRRAPA